MHPSHFPQFYFHTPTSTSSQQSNLSNMNEQFAHFGFQPMYQKPPPIQYIPPNPFFYQYPPQMTPGSFSFADSNQVPKSGESSLNKEINFTSPSPVKLTTPFFYQTSPFFCHPYQYNAQSPYVLPQNGAQNFMVPSNISLPTSNPQSFPAVFNASINDTLPSSSSQGYLS